MKVLLINSVCGVGSTGRICTDIADQLSQEGNEVKIAYGRGIVPEKYKKYAVKIGTEMGVYVNGLKARLFDNEGFNAKRATNKFIAWVKKYNPDVIHLHNLHGYYLNVEILFSYLKTCGKKIVWTLHDCWAFTGHCSHFTIAKCEQWKEHCFSCPQRNSYPKTFTDRSKRNYDRKRVLFTGVPDLTIVTPSKWLAGLVKESFLKKYPIEVINNGIDLNVFKPTPSDFKERYVLQNKKIILGVASVWDMRKGFDDFLKLAKILDDTYRIVLVGVNKKQLKQLPKNVIGIERTNNVSELAEIYTTADVFFNPTYEDNYPTVNLEAQACGTPVITYNTGGSPECISQTSGIVIECNNIGAIKKEIERIIEIKPFIKENCLIQARHFEKNERFQEYVDLY
ncbi:MAG: glycosyltransferase [Candidatus Scatosoma sp.]